MNGRLKSLIDRGYSVEEIEKLAMFSDEEVKYASEIAFSHAAVGCFPDNNNSIYYIGGQPGSGKTVVSSILKNKFGNYVEIGIDNYRMYHPRYLEIEDCIRRHWENRQVTENDSPGNDIADFTHLFAGNVMDEVVLMASKSRYNILMEWSMRDHVAPLKSMKEFKDNGYNINVLFLGVNGKTSIDACNIRADVVDLSDNIIRKVPLSFHDNCMSTLGNSMDTIYNIGFKNKIIDNMYIIDRDMNTLWNNNMNVNPSVVFDIISSDNYVKENSTYLAKLTYLKEREGLTYKLDDYVRIHNKMMNFSYDDNSIKTR